jgi:UDP:flavonoid glycosyltransferase YjiC (YdhE family)
VRIAFVTNPAIGHVLPLLPLAIASRDAGHDVAVVGGASVGAAISAVGLRHVDAGPPDLPTVFAQVPERNGLTGRALALVTWRRAFAGILAESMAAGVLDLARSWQPDLVVHEDSEQGSWIAAERLGVPHVALQATAWRGTLVRASQRPLGQLRARYGLAEDPQLERWFADGYLTTRPPSLRHPDERMPASARPIRPVASDEAIAETPAWVARRAASARRVVITLGTAVPDRAATLAPLAAAFADLDAEVVVTTGPGIDTGALGSVPPNVRVETYVPMSRLLPTCDVVAFHGGSGTMLAALAAGVPLVVMPVAADQPDNADRCVAAGVGVALGPRDRDPVSVRRAVDLVLGTPSYRAAARRLRDEINAMPDPASVVPFLESLARGS